MARQSSKIDQQKAALEAELLRRVEARRSIVAWMSYRGSAFAPARHHRLIIEHLEAVERGDIRRLMLVLPPGSAKSFYASVEFPAWYLGRNPGRIILAASHSYALAERFGKRARAIVASPEFRLVFGSSLSDDQQSSSHWTTTAAAEYLPAGVGTGISGIRADVGLIDDPVPSREAADSERFRDACWDWYVSDFKPRLKPDARQILIQTRWHEDDLAGRILDAEAEAWKVVRIPMEADSADDPLGRAPGERLWAEWFTDEMVADAKRDARVWNSLYQGNPLPDTGEYFRRDWFADYDELPPNLEYYGASDYAVSSGRGDYTELGIFGIDSQHNIYVVDWWAGQTTPDEWIDAQCALINKYRPSCFFGEKGVIRNAVEPALVRRMHELSAWCRLEWLPSISEKDARARAIQSRASMGKIRFPKSAPWRTAVLSQLLTFPAGRRDDAVDVFSLLGRGLLLLQEAAAPRRRANHLKIVSNLSWMA